MYNVTHVPIVLIKLLNEHSSSLLNTVTRFTSNVKYKIHLQKSLYNEKLGV